MNQTLKANLCILAAAIIWGTAFVTQRMGMDSMGPVFFNCLRMLLGAAVLLVVAVVTDRMGIMKAIEEENMQARIQRENSRKSVSRPMSPRMSLAAGGMACGAVLFCASNSQQIGLVSVDAGKSGFLTALYIVLVPLIGIALRKPVHSNHLVAAALGVFGLYFLCINGSFSIQTGDLFSLIGALFWAFHILVIDHFSPVLNPIKLSAAQFFVCGILSGITALAIGEDLTLDMISDARFAIVYTGIMSSAVAFTLQTFAQRYANATAASIIMSMEALFATIAGFLFLGEIFTSREFIGALFMLSAVIIAQFTFREIAGIFSKKKK